MVKNIMAGAICLFCINMLFNKAAVNRLESEIKELEIENAYIQEQLLWEENYMDSLERVILDLKFEHERN
jgi:hypothetical protein|tara:strand:- start:261 stop:470 length:210 start_codon:yes stop_codon:yes gene_type:complete